MSYGSKTDKALLRDVRTWLRNKADQRERLALTESDPLLHDAKLLRQVANDLRLNMLQRKS